MPDGEAIQIAEINKIADALSAIDGTFSSFEQAYTTHTHAFADLTGKPTTIAGYGITDAMTTQEVMDTADLIVASLRDGVAPTLDTLKKLAAAIKNDPKFHETVAAADALRVAVDAAQSFTLAQKAQGRANINAVGTDEKGRAGGVAPLGSDAKVPVAYLPPMDYLPLAGGKVSGQVDVRSGTKAAQAFPFALGWTDTAYSIWKAVLETNGDLTFAGYNGDNGVWMQSPLTLKRGGGIKVTGNVEAGASGILEGNGNVWGSIWGTNLWNYLNGAGTLLGAAAYPRRSDGAKIVFNWSGQGGQPTWLWGGSDGYNMYVYNPANFSVNWANSAGNANTVGGWSQATIADQLNWRVSDTRFAGYIEHPSTTKGVWQQSSGYVVTGIYRVDNDRYAFGTRQPQIYIPNVGWRALGAW
ncbi:hypothetical protein [Brucella intermedia]|uniref:hypothetical protein n=1 Tax=Brucella intermedia TaxID=94625 RepID=UPI0012FDF72F|nr:hypothetical protein [Brucella intermedia]